MPTEIVFCFCLDVSPAATFWQNPVLQNLVSITAGKSDNNLKDSFYFLLLDRIVNLLIQSSKLEVISEYSEPVLHDLQISNSWIQFWKDKGFRCSMFVLFGNIFLQGFYTFYIISSKMHHT